MIYSKKNIGKTTLTNKTPGEQGLSVDVHVDSFGVCTISLGDNMTIMTNEAGVDDLKLILHKAAVELMIQRNKATDSGIWETKPLIDK